MTLRLQAAARLLMARAIAEHGVINVGEFVRFIEPVNGKSFGQVRQIGNGYLVCNVSNSKVNLRFGYGVEERVPADNCMRCNVTDIPN